jgi:cobalt-precorrin-5B (C1)-methyltransferase
MDVLADSGLLEPAMGSIMGRLHEHLRSRAVGELCIEAVVFSQTRGVLGVTSGADELLARHALRRGERA